MDPDRFRINRDRLMNEQPPLKVNGDRRVKNQSDHKTVKWAVGIIVLVLVIGLGTGLYLKHKTSTVKKKVDTSTIKKSSMVKTSSINIPSSSYASAAYGVTFSYPSSWTVSSNTTGPLILTSPIMNLTADTGNIVKGEIVMTMATTGYLPAGFGTQSVAVLNSQKLNFTNPSSTQAAATYISFIQYPTTNVVGGMDAIYLTDNYGYLKDQNIPSSNITSTNPFIGFSFVSCASSGCSSPLTILSNEWSNQSFSAPILLIIKSFSFD